MRTTAVAFGIAGLFYLRGMPPQPALRKAKSKTCAEVRIIRRQAARKVAARRAATVQ